MFRQWRLRRRCKALAGQCRQASLSSYIEACTGQHVDRLINTPLISVDLELTGLDPGENQIIAIGWTQVDQGRIRFGSNQHIMVNAEQSVGHSAAIHELMDSDVAKGIPLETGLQALFEAAVGRVWLFHHAGLDVAFLQQACLAWAGVTPPFAVLDTMQMELVLKKRRDQPIKPGDLQLSTLRSRYNLPRYTAHNALIDACATAELMLALACTMDPSGSLRLQPHIRYF
ncbi:MAG: exonuclease domain-containing protein [Xanthomonadales bacterium]|nr:exonuclease domain-containing protein [Xanthomonadales bacterium]